LETFARYVPRGWIILQSPVDQDQATALQANGHLAGILIKILNQDYIITPRKNRSFTFLSQEVSALIGWKNYGDAQLIVVVIISKFGWSFTGLA
jgi:hypothetical protein